ncbi:unnamed protein product [Protopolystoma xenopodis]|uniref:Uncharacterized protein n=1 Tax=Protopolystoma xenopodis TaxID=117903 RepID=A0A3S5BJ89_9PLAT|nr:unnamed protein product [Protopolystoma xenopodis]
MTYELSTSTASPGPRDSEIAFPFSINHCTNWPDSAFMCPLNSDFNIASSDMETKYEEEQSGLLLIESKAGALNRKITGSQDQHRVAAPTSERALDVYRNPVPSTEATKGREALSKVKQRIICLLDEWPEQPMLVREWERNAARHVSVQEEIQLVSVILVEWRKLELR